MAGFAPKVHPAKHCDSSTICASSREQTCAAPQGTTTMRGVWRCEVPQNRHHPLGSSQLPHQHQNQAVWVDLRAWPPPPQLKVMAKDWGHHIPFGRARQELSAQAGSQPLCVAHAEGTTVPRHPSGPCQLGWRAQSHSATPPEPHKNLSVPRENW